MMVREIMRNSTEALRADDSVMDAARHMKTFGVGVLPVLDEDGVAGVVTDRDLVTQAVAEGKDLDETRVSEVMTPRPIAIFEDQEVVDAAQAMMGHGVRRLIVLDRDGNRTGMVSLDDLGGDLRCAPLVQEVLTALESAPPDGAPSP